MDGVRSITRDNDNSEKAAGSAPALIGVRASRVDLYATGVSTEAWCEGGRRTRSEQEIAVV